MFKLQNIVKLRLRLRHSGSQALRLRLRLRLRLSDRDSEPGLTLKSWRPPPLELDTIVIRLVLVQLSASRIRAS